MAFTKFEAAVGTDGVVNIEGLTPGAARALNRFEQLVVSAGGRVVVKSAYRPATYQAHLQELWDKWMLELRHNFTEECAPLRAIVWDEFSRHDLLAASPLRCKRSRLRRHPGRPRRARETRPHPRSTGLFG